MLVGSHRHQCVNERYPSRLLKLYSSRLMGAQHNELSLIHI